MNDEKLNRLFRAARQDAPSSARPGFENLVVSAIRHQPRRSEVEPSSLFDQLGELFPHLAGAAAVVVALCVAADFGLTAFAPADLTDSLAELSEQWLFATN